MQTDVCWHALVSSDVYWCVLNRTHVSPLAFYDKKTVHLSTINNTSPGMMKEERQGKHRNPQSRSTPARWWWTASAARVTSDVNIRNSMMMDGLGAWALSHVSWLTTPPWHNSQISSYDLLLLHVVSLPMNFDVDFCHMRLSNVKNHVSKTPHNHDMQYLTLWLWPCDHGTFVDNVVTFTF